MTFIRDAAKIGSGGGGGAVAMVVSPEEETYSEVETEARREAALKRMLNTPHKSHKASKASRRKSAASVADKPL